MPEIGHKIIKTFKIYFEGNEVLLINNYDENYMDFWLAKKDKARRVFQGIDDADALKLRVNSKGVTGDAGKTAVAKTFGNRFRIPIDFELLHEIGPYHQASLDDKLEIKLTFNYSKTIILGSTPALAAAADADYDYSVTDIRTEWDQITSLSLVSLMMKLALPFTRVFEHRFMSINKSDPVGNLLINAPSKSMSKILILAVDPDGFFNTPRSSKISTLQMSKSV